MSRARSGADAEAREALAFLCTAYWLPLYSFARRLGHASDDALDLTQGYFALLIEKDYGDVLTGLHDPKGVEKLRHERTQLLHTVRARHGYYDRNAARAQVLLKREVPIDREQGLEALRDHKLQEFTVALGRPPQINDVMCVVTGQITQQRPRHTLIEQ